MSVRQIRIRYLTLYGLRWLPSGLLMPVMILLMQERGLTLSQIGLVATAQGLVVLALELPTGGFADALGRKPVLVAAWAIGLGSLALMAVADSFWMFFLVWALQGVYRALDSGPMESWYVDATLAADPKAEYERGLGWAGTVIGVAIGAGALLSGGLVALGPVGPVSALALPVIVAAVLQAVSIVALLALMAERRPASGPAALRASVVDAPRMVGQAVGLLRRNRVLAALVAVELFWGFGMVTFESLLPVRLAEVLDDPARAAALLGPAGTAAWLANAAGAALTPFLLRRLGAAPAAALMRILQGVTVVGMGLLAGPVGILIAYLACYTVHGASNPLHMGLLHRQVDGAVPHQRAVAQLDGRPAAGALGAVTLTALADATNVSTAMIVGGVVLAVAAPLYLPAWRAARRTPSAVDVTPEVTGGGPGHAGLASEPPLDAADRGAAVGADAAAVTGGPGPVVVPASPGRD
ncbi:major facilitator superfamily transporter [Micromonospora sp. M42]|nr:major facilitator superfamily transporter [Micromonospora sp. M42]